MIRYRTLWFFLIVQTTLLHAQTHFVFTANTGNNATVAVPTSANPNINGTPLSMGDEIGVFTPAGLCVGAVVWTGSNTAVTVWGDNDQTPEVDGIRVGEEMKYRVWQKSSNTEFAQVTVTYSQGNGIYAVNGIYALASLTAAAGTQTHFTFTANTGNNATVAIPTSANPNINGTPLSMGDEIGVFTPAGLCVGAVVWQGTNTAITVWGDNDQTPEIDGILVGEQMHYRVWQKSTNKEFAIVSVIYSQGDGIYAVNGIYVLASLSVVTSVGGHEQEVPHDFHLSQNYPNPFNPVTTIQFSLPKESTIKLTIFNSLGMQVDILVNQHLPAGHYRVQWTPNDMPSGVYFYQIRSDEFNDTKKLLLLR